MLGYPKKILPGRKIPEQQDHHFCWQLMSENHTSGCNEQNEFQPDTPVQYSPGNQCILSSGATLSFIFFVCLSVRP